MLLLHPESDGIRAAINNCQREPDANVIIPGLGQTHNNTVSISIGEMALFARMKQLRNRS